MGETITTPDNYYNESLFEELCPFCQLNNCGGHLPGGSFDKFYNYSSAMSHHRIGTARPIIEINGLSDKNVVYSDLAPLAPGHLLLVPKGHIASAALVPDEEEFKSDTSVLINMIISIFQGRAVAIFEHGAGLSNSGKLISACSNVCDNNVHSHVHFLPAPRMSPYVEGKSAANWEYGKLRKELMDILLPHGWDNKTAVMTSEEIYGSMQKEFVKNRPYLMLGILEPNGVYKEMTLLHDDDENRKIPSQTFRRLLAQSMNGGNLPQTTEWNYRHIIEYYMDFGAELSVPQYRRWLSDLLELVQCYNASN